MFHLKSQTTGFTSYIKDRGIPSNVLARARPFSATQSQSEAEDRPILPTAVLLCCPDSDGRPTSCSRCYHSHIPGFDSPASCLRCHRSHVGFALSTSLRFVHLVDAALSERRSVACDLGGAWDSARDHGSTRCTAGSFLAGKSHLAAATASAAAMRERIPAHRRCVPLEHGRPHPDGLKGLSSGQRDAQSGWLAPLGGTKRTCSRQWFGLW